MITFVWHFFQAVRHMTCSECVIRHSCEKVRVLNEKPSMQRKRKSKQAPTESVIMFHTILHSPFFSLHLVLSILPFPLCILFPPFFVYHSPFMILFSLFIILHSPSSLFHSLFKSLFIHPFCNISPFSRRVPFSINFFFCNVYSI